MKIIIGDRISGKTTQLIYESAATGAIIACLNLDMVEHIKRQAYDMNLIIPTPITHAYFIKSGGRGYRSVLIDDVGFLLSYLAKGAEIAGFSLLNTGGNNG